MLPTRFRVESTLGRVRVHLNPFVLVFYPMCASSYPSRVLIERDSLRACRHRRTAASGGKDKKVGLRARANCSLGPLRDVLGLCLRICCGVLN